MTVPLVYVAHSLPAICRSHSTLANTSLAIIPYVHHHIMVVRPIFPHGPPRLPEIEDVDIRHQVYRHRSFFARSSAAFEDQEGMQLVSHRSNHF